MLSSPCVFMVLSLSSLVHMSVCVYCSIREKVFHFYCICVHTFSYLSLPSCYIGTGTLLIDWPSYLKFSVCNGCLWVVSVVVFIILLLLFYICCYGFTLSYTCNDLNSLQHFNLLINGRIPLAAFDK